MRHGLLALIFGCVLASIGVLAAEWWARAHETETMVVVTDPPGMKYALSPSQAWRGRGWVEGTQPPPTIHHPRVICLGDSVTFGVKANALLNWPMRIQGWLRAQTGTPDPMVYNFAIVGWDAEQVATLATSRLDAWHPDLVIWGTYVNDVEPTRLLYDAHGPIYVDHVIPEGARLLPQGAGLWLLPHSALYRRILGARYVRHLAVPTTQEESASFYAHQLDTLIGWARDASIPLVIAVIPPHALADPSRCPLAYDGDDKPCTLAMTRHDQITALMAQRSVPWVDVLPAFQASGQAAFYPAQGMDPDHPNEAGHAIIASTVLPLVQQALGLPVVSAEVLDALPPPKPRSGRPATPNTAHQ